MNASTTSVGCRSCLEGGRLVQQPELAECHGQREREEALDHVPQLGIARGGPRDRPPAPAPALLAWHVLASGSDRGQRRPDVRAPACSMMTLAAHSPVMKESSSPQRL